MTRASVRRLIVVGAAFLLLMVPATAGAAANPTISPASASTTVAPQPNDVLSEQPASGTDQAAVQWLDCRPGCTSILGATADTYKVTTADLGATIEVQETATDASMPTSDPTLAVGAPVNISAPTIPGVAQAGQTLTEANGTWTNGPVTLTTYQWLDCDSSGSNCVPIANAVNQAYTLTTNDIGGTIEVQETASNGFGAGGPSVSAPTLTPPGEIAPPAISGTPQQGRQLTLTDGSWTNNPTSLSDQWLRCDDSGSNCAAILNADGPAYTLSSADVGNTVELAQTAANAAGTGGPAFSSPTAVVAPPTPPTPLTPIVNPSPSSTALLAVPVGPVTNQPLSLVATVTSSAAGTAPHGTVTFDAAGAPISGCAPVAISAAAQTATVTCPAVFSAAQSPEQLAAIFTPGSGSGVTGSRSDPVSLTIGRAGTATTLAASPDTAVTGSQITYRATVVPAQGGAFIPSGSVRFSDRGHAIGSCRNAPVRLSGGSLSAQCRLRYATAGTHAITARYSGDGGFAGSSSASRTVRVSPRTLTIAGAITAQTRWTYVYTATYTRFTSMKVHNLGGGTTVLLICRGGGCPFSRRGLVASTRPCGGQPRCVIERDHVVDLLPLLRGRRLAVGTVLTIELSRPNWIGKAYVITIRSGRTSPYRIACLKPGSTRPGVGC
jgi:hypothetical protein